MRLSTKGRYGLKAMFDLAMNYGDKPVSLTTIAARQGVSVNYLEQLISPLRKAGLYVVSEALKVGTYST